MLTRAEPVAKPAPLHFRPSRAVHYDTDRLGDPTGLLAPPYDDLGATRARELGRRLRQFSEPCARHRRTRRAFALEQLPNP